MDFVINLNFDDQIYIEILLVSIIIYKLLYRYYMTEISKKIFHIGDILNNQFGNRKIYAKRS